MQHDQQLNVIPYPAIVDFVGPDYFRLPDNASISCCAALQPQAEYLQHGLEQRLSMPSNVQQRPEGSSHNDQAPINLRLMDDLPALWPFRWSQEGYELVCNAQGITITAITTTGVFYGIQTLLQALSVAEGQQGLRMPYTRVVDAPRFLWRGVLLDAGRHFFPVPFILKLLDLLALYKMNRFHWHLTEDQGWRLEVPSLPRLAEVAAWRGKRPAAAGAGGSGSSSDEHTPRQQQQQQQGSETAMSESPTASRGEQQQQQQQEDPEVQQGQQQSGQQQQPQQQWGGSGGGPDVSSVLGRPPPSAAVFHGGYYSEADVAKVVSYAAARCIEVVPEIELPGHCVAALAAYPHLSCTGEVSAVSTHWGIHEDVYCAGNDGVFTFLERVLDQVISQFPSPYIHIGGDEVPKVRWQECSKCQAVMEAQGLTSEAELQSWFVRRISNYLASRNRRLIGWDEILEGGLCEGATVMSWRGNIGGIIAAKSGHDVIMTPTSNCYFDYRQAPSAVEPGAWYACLPLHVVYAYDPIPGPWQELTAEGLDQEQDDADADDGVLDGMMMVTSPPDSSAGGGSPPSRHMDDASSGGGGTATAEQQQQPDTASDVPQGAAAVVPPAAAAAAGPHYPGHPPGASLAPLAAAAGAAAAPGAGGGEAAAGSDGGSNAGSSRHSRQGVLSESEAAHILGSQANLWTEYVADEATAEYMLLPRLAALAEAVWTPVEVKDWGAFMRRLQDHLPLLDKLGYMYRPLGP